MVAFEHFLEKQKRIKAGSTERNRHVQNFDRLTIDCRPDVEILAVDVDFHLVEGHLLSVLAVGFEQVLAAAKSVSDCLVTTPNERFNLPVREVSMI